MTDETTVPRVAEAMAHRVAERAEPVMDGDPRVLERRLAELDGWTLGVLVRLTASGEDPRGSVRRHLGVVGVDHSLNALVVDPVAHARRDLDSVDLDALDDDDLIAAARYLPETLPGYLLG